MHQPVAEYRRIWVFIVVLGLLLTSGSMTFGAPSAARAAGGDGTVTVRAVRDFFSDAAQHAQDVNQAGLNVVLSDKAGTTITAKTGADGRAVLTPASSGLASGWYRVEVTIPPELSYLKPVPAGNGLSTFVEFVNVAGGKNASLTVGVANPGDYAQAKPDFVTPTSGYAGKTAATPSEPAVVRWPYDRRGDATKINDQSSTPNPTTIATYGQVGTVYGTAYQPAKKLLFTGALAKRHTQYGSGGSGAIYVLDGKGGASRFAVLPNAGGTPHGTPDRDETFFGVPGKEGLGDLEISDDGKTLYAVNLANRTLASFDISHAALNQAPVAPTAVTPINNPGCSAADDWRPFGLGRHDGKIYIGGVCSAESSQKVSDLKAYVLEHDPVAKTTRSVFSHSLDFQRGPALFSSVDKRDGDKKWHPWDAQFDPKRWYAVKEFPESGFYNFAQPEFSDIEFDGDRSLILGFRDRFGDQLGSGGLSPDPGDKRFYFVVGSAGALERACKNGGGWSWQGENGCPNNNTGESAQHKGAGVSEYYSGTYALLPSTDKHAETAQGGVAFAPRFPDVATTAMDPTTNPDPKAKFFTGGIGLVDNKTGAFGSNPAKGYAFVGEFFPNGFGKANGLGDLEMLVDQAPIQLGDRVFVDANGNGVHDADPSEPGLAGVKVALRCPGVAPKSTTTNGEGRYFFNDVPANAQCSVTFDASAADTSHLPGAPPPSALKLTAAQQGTDRQIDSNPDPATSVATVKTGDPGESDHTIDAGYVPPPVAPPPAVVKIGDFVWLDNNGNGVQDGGEPPVGGATVTLKDPAGTVKTVKTDSGGKYTFDNLSPSKPYTVCFDASTATGLPSGVDAAGLKPTTQNAGGDKGKDSNIGADGCAQVTTPATGEDLTIDAGFSPAPPPTVGIGDFVWLDNNGNGVQDGGEPPIAGATVTLKDPAGSPVNTATTDSGGKYTFDNLPPSKPYTVCFDASKATGLPSGVSAAGLKSTTQNAGGDKGKDSNIGADGCAQVTTPATGKDLTIDAGFVAPPPPPPAVVKMGDFVWLDNNGNGVQDGGERPIGGATVTLKDPAGTVKTVKTDSSGKYILDGVKPATEYQVCFDASTATGLPSGVDAASLKPTKQKASGDKGKDSDPGNDGCAKVKSPATGEDLTIDAGYVPPSVVPPVMVKIGNFVWLDNNRNGMQDGGEPPVGGATVTLKDPAGTVKTVKTDSGGKYIFDNLPPSKPYTVCFDASKATGLPGGVSVAALKPTKQNAGRDRGKDSNIGTDGCAKVTTPATGEDLTIDAGFVAPAPSPVKPVPGPHLPITGSSALTIALWGAALLVGGGILWLAMARRRRGDQLSA